MGRIKSFHLQVRFEENRLNVFRQKFSWWIFELNFLENEASHEEILLFLSSTYF